MIVAARAAWLAEKDDKAAAPPAPRVTREAPSVPEGLAAALQSRAGARTRFDVLTAAQQREYVDWVGEARREATRASRIVQAVAWIAEGKTRNWKYQSC
ncbi:MAG: YdeI/OmpD-associated family protein [Caulobacter sp.]|nr:YdeI/OmpD-associated family protein [Vitreoscilla sp.]